MGNDENKFDEVGKLLGSLGRVEPPGDFEVRVRARIARGRPSATGVGGFAWVRVVVPAVLLIAIGGYFGWTALNSPVTVPAVAEIQPEPNPVSSVVELPANRDVIQPEQLIASRTPETVVLPPPAGSRANSVLRPKDEPEGGSVDFSLTPDRSRFPRGLAPNSVISNANVGSLQSRSAGEVLGMLGIAAACSATGCRVNAVSANSVAARSGLREGDVIEAVDSIPLRANTTFGGQFSAASVRVRRAGAIVTIGLRP